MSNLPIAEYALLSDCRSAARAPSTGELLGNFPRAFSHIGLVNAALAISQAQ